MATSNKAPQRRRKAGEPALVPKLVFTAAERARAAQVVELFSPLVPVLAQALDPRTEVVLHDLTCMPDTIAAIGGSITGREVGGPPTDLGLRDFASGRGEHQINYRTETGDGLVMRSSSLFFHAPSGKAVACLCINSDIDDLERARKVLAALTGTSESDKGGAVVKPGETFPVSVDKLAEGLLRNAIEAVGAPVDLMKKSHKIQVVQELNENGFFNIREAVDIAAKRLQVSRYTVYNYLNELGGVAPEMSDGDA